MVVRGKLAGLLELGAGFQQDLSGRENIYLNGSMLGLSKTEVDRLFDDIVDFAELEQFIDNQVKFYSSGMYVRLGFAVAVNVDPDVLVIDEVLAVGDERFQRKCMDRIKRFQSEGRTILFVSHSPDQVRAICDRAVVLSDGNMIGMGPPGEAVRLFRERLLEAGDELALGSEPAPEGNAHEPPVHAPRPWLEAAPADDGDVSRPVRLRGVEACYPDADERRYLTIGETLIVRIHYQASVAVDNVVFALEVRMDDGSMLFRTDTEIMGLPVPAAVGSGRHRLPLRVAAPLRRHLRHQRRRLRSRRHPLRLAGAGVPVRDDEPRTGHRPGGPAGPTGHRPGRPGRRLAGDRGPGVTAGEETGTDQAADGAYLAQVMAEIDEEVRRRRASGDLPPRLERELDELFLEHSPVAGRGGGLDQALRMVDAAAFIDPVVPISSNKSGGALVKKGLRTLNLWYIGYVTHQVSQFAAAVSRSLHLLDDRLAELRTEVEAQRVPAAVVVEAPWAVGADAWWVPVAVGALAGVRSRVLHAAAGDGWLVRQLVGKGVDAYGVDPRPGLADRGELGRFGPARGGRARAPAGGRAGCPGRDRPLRRGGRHDPRRADPAARGRLRPAGPRRDPRRALPLPVGVVVGGRAGRGRPLPGAAAARRHLAAPARPARLRGHRHRGAVGDRLPGDGRPARGAAPTVSPTPEAAVDRPPPGGAVHQFVPALIARDATGSHTLLLRQALRDAGWRSEIFAEATHDELLGETLPIDAYRGLAAPGDVLVYQFSTSSAVADFLAERPEPLVLDYHNVTRPALYGGWDPVSAARSAAALEQLGRTRPPRRLGPGRQRLQRGRPASRRAARARPWCRSSSTSTGWWRRPTPGWRRAWPPARRTAARTGCSWGGWCPRRPSTTW